MKHGHAVEVAWTLLTIAEIFVNVSLRTGRIEIELKDLLQRRPLAWCCGGSQRFKAVHHAVPGAEEDQVTAGYSAHRGGSPGVVKNIGRDVFVLTGKPAAVSLIQDYEAGRIRGADALVCVIHTAGGVEVKVIAVNQDRAMCGIVGPDSGFGR